MNDIGFGFIGAGKVAHASAAAVTRHARARLVAVQDVDRGRRDELADAFDVPLRCDDAQSLLDCPEVHAVYVAVPNRLHAALTQRALRAGKHVIVEKPFAMNAGEAEQMIAEARAHDRVLTVGMNQRFLDDAQRIKSTVSRGALGEIYYAKAYWLRREGIPKLGTWFCRKDLAGAGAINDIGVHLLDLCLHLMGDFKPASVFACTYGKFGHRGLGEGGWGLSDRDASAPFDVDDLSCALIKMQSGATVSLEAAWAAHLAESERMNVELFGTDAGASVYPARTFRRDPRQAQYQVTDDVKAEVGLPHCDRFHNFINHLTFGEPLLVKSEEALIVQRILDAIAESSRTGQSVRV